VEGVLRLRTLWRPAIDLEQLTVTRPQITLTSGREAAGFSPGTFERLLRGSLNIATHKILVREGWLVLNQKRIPLNLSLRDFECALSHQDSPPGYDISLAYEDGKVVWAKRDISYGLSAHLLLSTSGLDIESFQVRRPQSTFSGKGTLREWESPVLSLESEGTVGGGDFYLADPELAKVHGRANVSAHIRWDATGYHMQGDFTVPGAEYRLVKLKVTGGSFEIEDKVLRLQEVRGVVGHGAFRAGGALQLSGENPAPHKMDLAVTELPLKEAAQILGIPQLAMENNVDADAQIRWRHGLRDLEFDSASHLYATEAAGPAENAGTALAGDLAIDYRRGAWDIRKVMLRSPDSQIEISETAKGKAAARLETDRPMEVFRLARRVIPALDRQLIKHPDLTDLSGKFNLQGDLFLNLPDQAGYAGHIRVEGGRWRQIELDSLETAAVWQDNTVRLQSLTARTGVQSVEGELLIEFSRLEGEMPDFSARGDLQQIPLEYLRQLGLQIPAEATGILGGSGSLAVKAGKWSGGGKLQVENGSFNGTSFDFVSAEVSLEGHELRIRQGRFQHGPAKGEAGGTFDIDRQEVDLSGRLAELPLREIPLLNTGKLDLSGQADATVRIRGRLKNPAIEGDVELKGLRYGSWDLGRGHGSVSVSGEVLSLDLDVQSELGQLKGRATISTKPGYKGHAEISLVDWNLQKTVQANMPPILSDLSTALRGQVEVDGSFADLSTLSAQGELDGARLKIRDYELQNKGRIRFRVAEKKLRLEQTQIVGEGSSITVAGVVPLDQTAGLDLILKGGLNIQSLPHLAPGVFMSGTTDLDVRVGGSLRDPEIIGHATLHDALVAQENLPLFLSSAQGRLTFSRNAIALENIRGALGTGTATLNGIVEIRSAELRTMSLQLSVRRARLPYPQGFRSTVDTDLTLRGDKTAQVLVGKVTVIRSDYLADFNLIEQFAAQTSASSGPQAANPLLAGMSLNIAIVTRDGLYIDNQLARARARANLMLRGTFAYPVVTGRVEAVEGTIFFRGNRFEILRASADFTELKSLDPNLDIRAEADVKRYRLRLDVTGDLNDPHLSLTSDPPLPTVEIVLLLTAGISREDTTTGTTLTDEELMRQGAASLLSAGLTGALDKRVRRIFGLESFRVDPYWVGSQKDPTARVTVTERLSKDLTVTYSRNLSTNEEQVVIIEYDVSRNLTLVASQDEKGDFGIDFRFRKRLR
jgi:autotransporter translocation and assembly factor TamB